MPTLANTPVDIHSLRKQPTFCDAGLGSASDWLKQISHAAPPIKSTTHIFSITFLRSFLGRHFWGKAALTSQNVGCLLRLGHSVHKSKLHAVKLL